MMKKMISIILLIVMVLSLSSCSNLQPEKDELFHNGLLAVAQDGKWGYIDKKGEFVIEPQFDEVTQFYDDGYAVVRIDQKIMIIDVNGNEVFDSHQFDGIMK